MITFIVNVLVPRVPATETPDPPTILILLAVGVIGPPVSPVSVWTGDPPPPPPAILIMPA